MSMLRSALSRKSRLLFEGAWSRSLVQARNAASLTPHFAHTSHPSATVRIVDLDHHRCHPSCGGGGGSRRWYTPFTKEEEEREKARVSHLSPEEKDTELRQLNREIAKLETLKGINNGELYTWSGRYKTLMRDYGFPLFVYYWAVWCTTGLTMYLAIDIGGLDAMQLIGQVDDYMGWSLTEKVDPQLGKIGLVLVMNELLEPLRLPFVVVTLKPAMDKISPPKF